jgi:cytochrome c biogenesis protein CcmG, thiol:disulfide interchange protein DsbE
MNGQRILWAPLIAFILLSAGLIYGLVRPADRTISSTIVGARIPDFALAAAIPGTPAVASTDLAHGKLHLVNFFASWCVPCIAEAPQLGRIAAAGVPIVGIAVRDRPADVAAFLRRHGNPYVRLGLDRDSRTQIAFGSAGVPETFLVDGKGNIRWQAIGPVTDGNIDALMAAVGAAR